LDIAADDKINASIRRVVTTVTRLGIVRKAVAEELSDRRGADKRDHHEIEH
jgi:hypothetical protein